MDEGTKEESMNERIKELREQAADFASETYSKYTMATFDTNKSIETLFEEKFAELIVRECMEQVWYTREDGINGNVSEVIKDRIKEHFGVEE